MHADLVTRRRVLLLTYQRYMAADRAWKLAIRETQSWFPPARQSPASKMGNPGSPMRRLYDRRERAIQQLQTARLKLEVAKERLAKRHRQPVLLITQMRR
ncbi:hypothetical protein [Yoonia sediminilitoris]|uniref:Uncharacterized protein n=1 Tax=Yoonia sediminilitoris TaxID=1286148 RepID=A0A2T6KJN7_9RHOB|nr:hypothetical protein [Yoonia sediminilitoris]PUB16183.1 hypothetical protein C8N45_10336 [Yoonia sediminilitoris]RCW96532.1 hypothetical protein DFP92_10336 [Yoonia sediminilitoris]